VRARVPAVRAPVAAHLRWAPAAPPLSDAAGRGRGSGAGGRRASAGRRLPAPRARAPGAGTAGEEGLGAGFGADGSNGARAPPSIALDTGDALAPAAGERVVQPRKGALGWARALWAFSRPHTIVGTAISIVSVSLLAAEGAADLGAAFAVGVVTALAPALLMNVAIVGLNQLFDVEIDRVNKPYLPLASGAMSAGEGRAVVAGCAAAALALAWASASAPLLATVAASWALGVAYSTDVPGLRWKRFPVAAAMCILAVRAVLVQVGFFLHMRHALGHTGAAAGEPSPCPLSPVPCPRDLTATTDRVSSAACAGNLGFMVSVMVVYSVVIALFKDVPDVKGDEQAGVRTLSVRLGAGRVLRVCVGALMATFGAAAAYGGFVSTAGALSRAGMAAGHLAMAALLWRRAGEVDTSSSDSMYGLYMFVWKLFYAEYLLVPLFR